MNKLVIKLSLSLFAFGLTNLSYGQAQEEVDADILNWYNGTGTGMHTEKAYKLLKNKESEAVVVAIIDSGVDIEHEDLKGKIWINEDEIAGNGIDDDNNGYIDDVNGWNFLGNAKGENANDIPLEMTRIYAKLKPKYDVESVVLSSEEDVAEFELYLEVKEKVESTVAQYSMGLEYYKQMLNTASEAQKEEIQGVIDYLESALNVHYNIENNERAIVGDNPDDFNDVGYGNNDVEGPDALHGTHVSGIVAAIRGNELGGDGVADNVKIMSLRAVPNGDEYDKDIALAIRYAVDNGASIINMSFGKAYSPHAQEVYDAFAYADSKGVLLVHAAGNDAKNIDEEPNYPTSMYEFQQKKLDHFLTIGACTRYTETIEKVMKNKKAENEADKERFFVADIPASFSNYGSRGVDVFAPGHDIYNTFPNNEYHAINGTSMACPMVSGAAALLKSYFPDLTMMEIKTILLKTATQHSGDSVIMPGGASRDQGKTSDMMDFGNLSVTGGTINLYNAVKRCLEMEEEKASK